MCSLSSKFRALVQNYNKITSLAAISVRSSSYQSSPFVEDLGEINVKYEVTQNPEDWKYVERLFKSVTVPEPARRESYNSEWKPQSEDLKDQPYFIARNKNHMMPVYLDLTQRGMRKITNLKRIQGDIWLLEKQVKDFLQKGQLKPIRSQVNEFAGFIKFHGDHVNAIKYWLTQRGF